MNIALRKVIWFKYTHTHIYIYMYKSDLYLYLDLRSFLYVYDQKRHDPFMNKEKLHTTTFWNFDM